MHDTSNFAAVVAATLSSFSLALFGVDYYALLWGFFGAMYALFNGPELTRLPAISFVAMSTFAGAAIGSMVVLALEIEHRVVLIFISMVGGVCSQMIINEAAKSVSGVIARFLGSKP